jgi:hypothetical protein
MKYSDTMNCVVSHKQIYRKSAFGGEINTTLCGRARKKTSIDGFHNIADSDLKVTCKFCLRIMQRQKGGYGLPPSDESEGIRPTIL